MFDSRIAVFDPRPYSQCPRYLTSTITHIYMTAYFPAINRNCKIQKKMYDKFYTLVSKSNRTKLGKFYFESNGPSLIRPNQVFELQGVIKFKQMKNNKFHTVGTVSKSTRKIVDRWLSLLGTCTLIKIGGVKLIFWGTSLPS
jgi:hypothetical protein